MEISSLYSVSQCRKIPLKTLVFRADNEKEHAKMWFKELEGIGSTAENLGAAADGENYEWTAYLDMLISSLFASVL